MNKVHPLKAGVTSVWRALKNEAEKLADGDAALAPLIQSVVLPAQTLPESLGRLLSEKLAAKHLPEGLLLQLYHEFADAVPDLQDIVERDLKSIAEHDPAARAIKTAARNRASQLPDAPPAFRRIRWLSRHFMDQGCNERV